MDIPKKICSVCTLLLPIESFYYRDKNKGTRMYCCKKCNNLQRNESRRKNYDKELARQRKWCQTNRDKAAVYRATQRNKPETKEKEKQYRLANPDKQKEYQKRYRDKNPARKILTSLRSRIVRAINGGKSKKTAQYLGCTFEQLKTHLESLWLPGMSWENWGYGVNKWHIDHIRPCACFDLTDLGQQHKCFNYTNLQPLWHHDNILKSDFIQLHGKPIRARNIVKAAERINQYHYHLTIQSINKEGYYPILCQPISTVKTLHPFGRLYQLNNGFILCDSVGKPIHVFDKIKLIEWLSSKASYTDFTNLS